MCGNAEHPSHTGQRRRESISSQTISLQDADVGETASETLSNPAATQSPTSIQHWDLQSSVSATSDNAISKTAPEGVPFHEENTADEIKPGVCSVLEDPFPFIDAGTELLDTVSLGEDCARTEAIVASFARPRVEPASSEHQILLKAIRFHRNYSAWALAGAAIIITMFASIYAWGASLPSSRLRAILFNDPQITIFIINLLSHLTIISLDALISTACDNFRWYLCSRRDGSSLLEFIALAGSTSPLGLTQLLFSRSARSENQSGPRSVSYRLWPLQRLIVVLLKFTIGFVLLVNIDFQIIYSKTGDPGFQVRGGVVPFNFDSFEGMSTNFITFMATLGMGSSFSNGEHGLFVYPVVESVPGFACPPDAWSCAEMRLVRNNVQTMQPVNTSGYEYITLFQSPLYHLQVALESPDLDSPLYNSGCNPYHCPGYRYSTILCADTDKTSSLSVGYLVLESFEFADDNTNNHVPQVPGSSLHVAAWTQAKIQIKRYYADITYNLQTSSVQVIENESIATDVIDSTPNASYYMTMFDLLFPRISNETNVEDIHCYFQNTATVGMLQGDLTKVIRWLVLPMILPQLHVNTTSQTTVNASFSKQSYKITVSQDTFQIFTSFSLVVLIWCVILLVSSGHTRIPETSSFPELDLMEKFFKQHADTLEIPMNNEIASQLSERRVKGIATALKGINVCAYEDNTAQEMGNNAYELQPRV